MQDVQKKKKKIRKAESEVRDRQKHQIWIRKLLFEVGIVISCFDVHIC